MMANDKLLTDAQINALRKEFVWVRDKVEVVLTATYKEYKVFKCGQGHTSHVMFKGDEMVDITTFDYEFLLDSENLITFIVRTNSFYKNVDGQLYNERRYKKHATSENNSE